MDRQKSKTSIVQNKHRPTAFEDRWAVHFSEFRVYRKEPKVLQEVQAQEEHRDQGRCGLEHADQMDFLVLHLVWFWETEIAIGASFPLHFPKETLNKSPSDAARSFAPIVQVDEAPNTMLRFPQAGNADYVDCYIILGNTLDNAIEGALSASEGSQEIHLQLRQHKSTLFYKVESV